MFGSCLVDHKKNDWYKFFAIDLVDSLGGR